MAVPKFYGSATGATYSPTYTSDVTALNMDMFLKTARATVGSDIRAVRLTYSYGTSRTIYLYYYKGSGTSLNSYKISDNINWSVHIAELAEWGVTLASAYPLSSPTNIVTFNPTTQDEAKKTNILYGSLNGQSQRLLKLYASENGVAKQIYGKKNIPNYGTVYYIESSGGTEKQVPISSQAEWDQLFLDTISGRNLTFGGVTMNTSTNESYYPKLTGVSVGSDITSISDKFLYYVPSLKHVSFSEGIKTIGNSCIWYCTNLNCDITLPSTLTSIGTAFISYNKKMTGTIYVGNLSADIIASDNYTFGTTSNAYDAYTTGIIISGSAADAWLAKFPNSDSSPYRKLRKPPNSGYGTVYYTKTSTSENLYLTLQSQAEFNALCNSSSSGTITIQGVTLYKKSSDGDQYITGVDIGELVTSIPNYFAYFCRDMNHLTIPEGVTTIGYSFMAGTYNFNSNVTLPSTLTSISTGFFGYQEAMQSEINVGNLSADIAADNATGHTLSARNTSGAAYTQGIRIAGANRTSWLTKFSNRSSSPYRKLVDAGH